MNFDTGIDGEEWITVGQASRIAQVDPSTIRRWTDRGRVRGRVSPGGTRQVSLRSLKAAFERATAAKQHEVSARTGDPGPDPMVEAADPYSALVYLAEASPQWRSWTPDRRSSSSRLDALLRAATQVRDAIDDIIGVVDDELRDRAAEDR